MEQVQIIKDVVKEVLNKMNFSFTKTTTEEREGGIIRVNIESEYASLLIGTQGKNLEAIQHLVKSILWKRFGDKEKFYLVIDVEDFKLRREDQIIEMAKERAEAVQETKMSQLLPPMNPFLRRLVHLELTKDKYADIATDSVGEGTRRRVRIFWKGRDVSSNTDLNLEENLA